MSEPEADRLLYLPAVGLLLAAGAIGERVSGRFRITAAPVTVAAAILAAWALMTVLRTGDWRDNGTLWAHELRLNPASSDALTELAVEGNFRGRHAEAEARARQALAMAPENALAKLQLAVALHMQQRPADALGFYRAAVESGKLHPQHGSVAWANRR